AAFRYRDFRILWFGSCTSSIGTWMQNVAENWLVLSLTGSAFYLGLDAFLQQLPIMLFTLIGGVLADRLDRRRTLLVSQYIQMSTALVLALLVYLGVARIWHILMLSFTAGLAQAFGGPAYQALIPSLVEDKKDLPNAIAFNSIQINIARVLGPLVFGATITAFAKWGFTDVQGMAACFLVNALSFLVVISTLNMLRVKHIPYTGTTRMRDALRGGLAYVRHHGSLAALTVLAFATGCRAASPSGPAAVGVKGLLPGAGPTSLRFHRTALGERSPGSSRPVQAQFGTLDRNYPVAPPRLENGHARPELARSMQDC